MLRLSERQGEFAAALLDRHLPIPPGLVGPDGVPSAKRFSVYRNNVLSGLIDVLTSTFPAVSRIVGEEFFRAMVGIYVLSQPPRSPVLIDYGAGFPAFIEIFEPAQSLPYLNDVARLEWAWSQAYYAAEALPLNPALLEDLDPNIMAHVCFQFHPSFHLIRSSYPAFTIWQMNIGDHEPEPVDFDVEGENILMVRPHAQIGAWSIPKSAADFVAALAAGMSILEASKIAIKQDSTFDVSSRLAWLFDAGFVINYNV